MSLSATRSALAQSLEQSGANVYAFPASVVIPPAVVVIPSDPYVNVATIGNNGARVQQNFRLTVAVAPIDNESALDGLEQLIEDVLFTLPSGIGYQGGWSSPQMLTIGPSDLLASSLTIQVMTGLEPEPTPPPEESEEA